MIRLFFSEKGSMYFSDVVQMTQSFIHHTKAHPDNVYARSLKIISAWVDALVSPQGVESTEVHTVYLDILADSAEQLSVFYDYIRPILQDFYKVSKLPLQVDVEYLRWPHISRLREQLVSEIELEFAGLTERRGSTDRSLFALDIALDGAELKRRVLSQSLQA